MFTLGLRNIPQLNSIPRTLWTWVCRLPRGGGKIWLDRNRSAIYKRLKTIAKISAAATVALISLHNISIFPMHFPFSWYILMICLLTNDHNVFDTYIYIHLYIHLYLYIHTFDTYIQIHISMYGRWRGARFQCTGSEGGQTRSARLLRGGTFWVRAIFGIPPPPAINNDHSLSGKRPDWKDIGPTMSKWPVFLIYIISML